MPPAALDEISRQQTQSLGDNSSLVQDQYRVNPEPESTGKTKKKGKHGAKGKDKTAKCAAKTPPDDLSDPSPPVQTEPSSYQSAPFARTAGDPIVSPVLEALGTLNGPQENDTAYRTDAWAKSIPFGKSPPTDLIDGAFVGESPRSFPTSFPTSFPIAAERGGFSHVSASASPPVGRARPFSYGNGHLSVATSRQQSVEAQKRHSMGSHFQIQPPLPHMPQAHFYGAPDIDLPVFSGQNRSSSDGSYSFCAFDTISSPALKTTRMGGKVLVVGGDGFLEVLAIEDRKTRPIGRLVGLSGRVVEAKLLPWTATTDPFASSRPHVAVIVHGPAAQRDEERASSTGSEQNEILPGLTGKSEKHNNKEETPCYQTRAEIYSLRTGEHITTLFMSTPIPCYDDFPGLPLFAPSPVGNLKLYTSGSLVILACGVSGEVYIYGVDSSSPAAAYRCLAKTWTSIQSRDSRRYSTSSSSTDADGSQADSPHGSASFDSPIISVSGRWLAIVPPSSTSRVPLLGTVPASLIQGKIYGLDTHIPPLRPAVTCATDCGEGESFLNKVARGVTQELFRGARWMGDQGLQAWNSYWNKEAQVSQSASLRRPPHLADVPQQGYNMFPPTHAQETQSMSPAEPDLVSIIDLKRLEEGSEVKTSFPSPVATFQAPNGCSFVSFSPNGLMLLTASKKGDVQYVWDLMQIKYCRAATFLTEDPALAAGSSHVRQIARYTRLTTSTIIDVIWAAPTGEHLAIITRKGTIHVFDMPKSAFQWPPPRRARKVSPKSPVEDASPDERSEAGNPGNPFSAAMKLVGGKSQPILAAVRGRAPSVGPAFPVVSTFGLTSAAGVRSGKVVASGLSKSVGAAATGTVNTLRHAGENRLHLSGFSRDPSASRVTWFCNKDERLLGLVDNGSFKLYKIRRAGPFQKNRQSQSVIGGKVAEFKLPSNVQNPCGPLHVGTFNTESTVSASWALPTANSHFPSGTKLKSQALSQAEIETNTPYQPFHTDQRVNLYVFSPEVEIGESGLLSGKQWVFGEDIPLTKLHVRPPSQGDDDEAAAPGPRAVGEMENLISLGSGVDQVEEVVITTRRRKKRADPYSMASRPDEDGFFEDDCEVLDFARDRV
ncbi:hypothetical protein DTO164E3_129 [Paecilomyces variotii]|nr:hypothetical protein DTO032I3_4900 [Paecilomyces variotii]KAJ9207843.1 hypothetical protein DTO164E3_129 [Paecilomyces variotii]KAJ9245882.1 hypothetical protein DTO169E5_6 [Paecilomyces variotii]KAJ9260355.1 hypothetical protein DTO207G8_400 [Paecilomyces variotii]KAJ9277102.1 hypothetical protein DTO021D3_5999 [Paecilomyces variotii]